VKKLIFIVSTFNNGGAPKIISNIVMRLPEEYEALILLNDTENVVYPYKGKLMSLGLAPQADKLNLFYQFKVLLRRIAVLRKLKATGEYTAAISFLDSANIANILSGRKKCRTLVSVHNNLTESAVSWKYKYIVNPVIRPLYKRADRVITVSKGIEYDLIHNLKLYPDNIETIYNGHDITRIREQALKPLEEKERQYFAKGPVIGTMGRLNYQKAQWHLIRALTEVKKHFPDIRLIIQGEGELESYLKGLAEECGLKDQVIFTGFVNNPFRVLGRCDAMVLPSCFEGFPNALIEALALGLPCISTDFHSGAREILAPELPIEELEKTRIRKVKYGILTPVCDGTKYDAKTPLTKEERLLAEAIIMLLSDKELQNEYRRKAPGAVAQLDSETMVKKWLKAIET
jgi:glycosyltransferase involved in cell wall biosynthesis